MGFHGPEMEELTIPRQLACIALNPNCKVVDLYTLGMYIAKEGRLARWEDVAGTLPEYSWSVDWAESMPIYCFSCHSNNGYAKGGILRDSCSGCRETNPQLPSILFALHCVTGYPEALFQYLILQEAMRQLQPKPKEEIKRRLAPWQMQRR